MLKLQEFRGDLQFKYMGDVLQTKLCELVKVDEGERERNMNPSRSISEEHEEDLVLAPCPSILSPPLFVDPG
eukprot:c35861_g1_i1 orf=49-264(-)